MLLVMAQGMRILREPSVDGRDRQLLKRELSSELVSKQQQVKITKKTSLLLSYLCSITELNYTAAGNQIRSDQ